MYHIGDLRNGHYTAVIKDGKDWYLFDDTNVKLVRSNYSLGSQFHNSMSMMLMQMFLFSYHQINGEQLQMNMGK